MPGQSVDCRKYPMQRAESACRSTSVFFLGRGAYFSYLNPRAMRCIPLAADRRSPVHFWARRSWSAGRAEMGLWNLKKSAGGLFLGPLVFLLLLL